MKVFYNELLMPTHQGRVLLTVLSEDGTMPDFENHQGAIMSRLKKLIIDAQIEDENISDLFENYLNVTLYSGSPADIAFQLMQSPQMLSVLNTLSTAWSNNRMAITVKSEVLDSNALYSAQSYSFKEQEVFFYELTLREYLEQLSMVDEEI